jgi:hypothetical protein
MLMTAPASISTLAISCLLIGGLGCKAKPDTTPPNPDDDGVMCTMDAKICPDGSAVGRSGPDCEFDPCPAGGGDAEPDSDEPDSDEPDSGEPDSDDEEL